MQLPPVISNLLRSLLEIAAQQFRMLHLVILPRYKQMEDQ